MSEHLNCRPGTICTPRYRISSTRFYCGASYRVAVKSAVRVTQWLRDNVSELKKQDARLKLSNDVFARERQSLITDNEILTMTVNGLQQKLADMRDNMQSLKQQACTQPDHPHN